MAASTGSLGARASTSGVLAAAPSSSRALPLVSASSEISTSASAELALSSSCFLHASCFQPLSVSLTSFPSLGVEPTRDSPRKAALSAFLRDADLDKDELVLIAEGFTGVVDLLIAPDDNLFEISFKKAEALRLRRHLQAQIVGGTNAGIGTSSDASACGINLAGSGASNGVSSAPKIAI